MAAKLKNLKVKKVDFVDEGANPDAHIRLFKSWEEPKVQKEPEEGNHSGVLKRLVAFFAKVAGVGGGEIDAAVEEIGKGEVKSFSDRLNEIRNRKIADEIWDTCFALQSALCSVLNDGELDKKNALSAMNESIEEFYTVIQGSVQQWSDGKEAGIVKKDVQISTDDLEVMKFARERLSDVIEKACAAEEETKKDQEMKGEGDMGVKIDKSKMSPAELAFYESIEKRCCMEDLKNADEMSAEGGRQTSGNVEDPVFKSAAQTQDEKTGSVVQDTVCSAQDDIYKGLHPAVKAELEELKKFREAVVDKELNEIAKRYAIIGKKAEELVPMLKGLKAAGGTAYEDMIAVLDHAVDTVEKSGMFSEIGKSGHGDCSENSAEARISSIAKGYMEKDPTLNYHAAVARAWEDNPDLMSEYEEEAGF